MPGADQTESVLVNASASYKETGRKTVTLTVTAPDGKTYSTSKSFDVKLTTPIASVKITPDVVKEGDSAIYDLTGRRIEHITRPGIYIIGGKKVIVKSVY